MLFWKRKKTEDTRIEYDKSKQKPILHKSICTGETTAGFKDLHTGAYMDVMVIRNDADLEDFMRTYGITQKPPTEY